MIQRMGLGYSEMGIRCLDDPELLTKAVTVSPKLVMADLPVIPAPRPANGKGIELRTHGNHTDHSLAQARLLDKTVEITAEGGWAHFLYGLENSLVKFCTPGLRLARFLATRFVMWRLNIPEGTRD
jgi:hypothetical protein